MNAVRNGSALYMNVRGEGDTVVLLHGWGMHSGIWGDFAGLLAQQFKVICIDLPGHGQSDEVCLLTLDAVVDTILSQVGDVAHWVGWSLGGSIVMHLLQRAPERVKSFVLLSSSPAFVSREPWRHGIAASVFEAFSRDLQTNYKKTLQRFLALQTMSCQAGKLTRCRLRESLFQYQDPSSDSLQQGLAILQQADLRETMQQSKARGLVVLGQNDQLVPASVAEFYGSLACRPAVVVIKGGGHAVFLSHPDETFDLVSTFIKQEGDSVVNE